MSASLFDKVVRFEPPKKDDPKKLRELAKALLDLQRAWFEDAMRKGDERLMTRHAEQMEKLEEIIRSPQQTA